MWFSSGLGSIGLMVGLDLEGLLQPKQIYDSKIRSPNFRFQGRN